MKTRRKKINRSPKNIYGRNCTPAVVEQGFLTTTKGHRVEGKLMQKDVKAKPAFVGREYTGVNGGKKYPYAGAKRGGLRTDVEPSITGTGYHFAKRLVKKLVGAPDA